MFRLRFTIDCQPRTKNGQPPQRTTGVARTNSTQARARSEISLSSGAPRRFAPIAARRIGMVSATLTQKRSAMLVSSGFSSSFAEMTRGSSAIPQIGHDPGSERTISGCIGHTYSVLADGTVGRAASNAIPHLGHAPGIVWCISGSIGQMYSATAALGLEGAAALGCTGTVPRTRPAAGELTVSIGLVPFQLDPARGSACDWLCGGLVENLVQIVGTALGHAAKSKTARPRPPAASRQHFRSRRF